MTLTTKYLTDDQLNNICDAIKASLPLATAAMLAKVSPATLWRYRRDVIALENNTPKAEDFSPEYVEFLQKFTEGLSEALAIDEQNLVNDLRAQSKKGNHKSTMTLLRQHHPHWREENQIINKSKEQQNFDEMSENELLELVEGEIVSDDSE
jgi:hypothetical protein